MTKEQPQYGVNIARRNDDGSETQLLIVDDTAGAYRNDVMLIQFKQKTP